MWFWCCIRRFSPRNFQVFPFKVPYLSVASFLVSFYTTFLGLPETFCYYISLLLWSSCVSSLCKGILIYQALLSSHISIQLLVCPFFQFLQNPLFLFSWFPFKLAHMNFIWCPTQDLSQFFDVLFKFLYPPIWSFVVFISFSFYHILLQSFSFLNCLTHSISCNYYKCCECFQGVSPIFCLLCQSCLLLLLFSAPSDAFSLQYFPLSMQDFPIP